MAPVGRPSLLFSTITAVTASGTCVRLTEVLFHSLTSQLLPIRARDDRRIVVNGADSHDAPKSVAARVPQQMSELSIVVESKWV